MTWADFVSQVNAQLSVDATRRGLESFRDRFIRNAVLDLQRYIPGYRQGNTTTYALADVAALDKCSLVVMPDGALPKEIWQYSTNADDDPYCDRHRLDFYPWERRQDLVCGRLDFTTWSGCCSCTDNCNNQIDCEDLDWCVGKAYVYTIGPHGKDFLVYPPLNDETSLLLVWDGYKTEFVDSDTIPFPAGASEAVAFYVKWKIALEVDKNIVLSREFQGEWRERRLSLYRDWKDTQDAESKGQEYNATSVAPP